MQNKSDIGIFGLGTMGRNLALNFLDKGFRVSVYNRLEADEKYVVTDFINSNPKIQTLIGFVDLYQFVNSLNKPRKILILVKAGKAVKRVIEQIIPLMDKDDIIIDGGNSHYADTTQRVHEVSKFGVYFIGCGISGGWYGALHGPSIMVGGAEGAWNKIKDLFKEIAAKDDANVPCCEWIGSEGSGHFVKMVHNGIEYAMMQIIAETYDIMHKVLGISNKEISKIFHEWNQDTIGGYLVEITAKVLAIEDNSGVPLIENVLDCSKQKGTGRDIAICGLEYGVVVSVITEAVNARFLSGSKQRRSNVSRDKIGWEGKCRLDQANVLQSLFDTIYCTHSIAIVQGVELIIKISEEQSWDINIQKVFAVWGNGCIIQSAILKDIHARLNKIVLDDVLVQKISDSKLKNFIQTVSLGVQNRIPMNVCSTALTYYLSLISNSLPANLIQLQREYFGSHGFERKDNPGIPHHLEEKDL
jgi:6-phosphogluconate dehydrogenase